MSEREEFDVVTRIVVDPRIPGVDGVSRQVQGLAGGVERMGARIKNAMNLAFGVVALQQFASTAKRVADSLLGIHTASQEAQTGIAGIFAAMNKSTVADEMGMAVEVIAQLRGDAAKGAGELQDYADAYQRLLAPVKAAGGALEDVRELTRLGLGAGFALRGQEGLKVAAIDILQGLQGGLSPAESQVLAPLLSVIGSSLDELNKAKPEEKLALIKRALTAMQPAVEATGKTWNAQVATLRDGVKLLVQQVTAPLFDRWSQQLEAVNTWMAANSGQMQAMVDRLGPRLVEIWDALVRNAERFAEATAAGAAAATAAKMGSMAGGLSGGLRLAGGGGVALGSIATAGAALAAVGAAAAAMTYALEQHPEMLGELRESFSLTAQAGQQLADASNRLAPALQRGADAIGSQLIKSMERGVHGFGILAAGLVKLGLLAAQAAESIGIAVKMLGIGLDTNMSPTEKNIARTELSLDFVRRTVAVVSQPASVAAERAIRGALKDWAGYNPKSDPALLGVKGPSGLDDAPELRSRLVGAGAIFDSISGNRGKVKPQPSPKIGPVTVNVNVEQAQDPNRVAITMDTVFKNLDRYRTQSRYAPAKPL
ncbi:MAG TPA: hypothetical protein VEB22_15455 [Phycisphaerales bacterium]|nr:hypothetical protein [Phycisphaerales bacterium]